MTELVSDWQTFSKGSAEFKIEHFYTLFHDISVYDDLGEIFAHFHEGEDLLVRFRNYQKPKTSIAQKRLIELIELDIKVKRRLCSTLDDGELLGYLERPKFSFVEPSEFKELFFSDIPHHWIGEMIGDHLSENRSLQHGVDHLLEAFYGATVNFNMVWYLAKPLYDIEFNPDVYFEIWRARCDYVIGYDGVYVVHGNAE